MPATISRAARTAHRSRGQLRLGEAFELVPRPVREALEQGEVGPGVEVAGALLAEAHERAGSS
jgi:hypothetical protein